MPSLSPGTAGAKEAYGISVLKEDHSIRIPPKAFIRYNLSDNAKVLLSSTRAGEGGFAILNIKKAGETVFGKIIERIESPDIPVLVNSRPYAITRTHNGTITFNDELMRAFDLKVGRRFLVIKSTTVTMSYNPVDLFKAKLEKHGFDEAVRNIDKLEVF